MNQYNHLSNVSVNAAAATNPLGQAPINNSSNGGISIGIGTTHLNLNGNVRHTTHTTNNHNHHHPPPLVTPLEKQKEVSTMTQPARQLFGNSNTNTPNGDGNAYENTTVVNTDIDTGASASASAIPSPINVPARVDTPFHIESSLQILHSTSPSLALQRSKWNNVGGSGGLSGNVGGYSQGYGGYGHGHGHGHGGTTTMTAAQTMNLQTPRRQRRGCKHKQPLSEEEGSNIYSGALNLNLGNLEETGQEGDHEDDNDRFTRKATTTMTHPSRGQRVRHRHHYHQHNNLPSSPPPSPSTEIPYISVAGRRKRRRTTFEDAFQKCLSMNDNNNHNDHNIEETEIKTETSWDSTTNLLLNSSIHTQPGPGSASDESFVMTPIKDNASTNSDVYGSGTGSGGVVMTPMSGSTKCFHNISKKLDYNNGIALGGSGGGGLIDNSHSILLQTPTPDRYYRQKSSSSSLSFDMDGNEDNEDNPEDDDHDENCVDDDDDCDANTVLAVERDVDDVDDDDSISSMSDNEFATNLSISMMEGSSLIGSASDIGITRSNTSNHNNSSSSAAATSSSSSSSSSRILYAPRKHKKQMQYLDPVDERIEDLIRHSRIKALVDAHRERHRQGGSRMEMGDDNDNDDDDDIINDVEKRTAESGGHGDNRHAERQRQRQSAYERYKTQNVDEKETDNGRDGYDVYQNESGAMTTHLRRKNASSSNTTYNSHRGSSGNATSTMGYGNGFVNNANGGGTTTASEMMTRPSFRDDFGPELRRRGGDMNGFGAAALNKSRSNSVPRAMKYSDSLDMDMSESE